MSEHRPPVDSVWMSHGRYLLEHPPPAGTPLAVSGCEGTLVVDSWCPGHAFAVRCDACWRIWAVGPALATASG